MGFNSSLEKTTAGMTVAEYINAVKVARKKMDGCETYGKWTRYIRQAWSGGTSVSHCANSIVSLAKGGER